MPQLRLTGVMLLGESERKTNLVTISAQPGWDDHGKDKKRIAGFYVEFRNNSDSPVFIVWEKSVVKYNNGSFSPFIQGQRYEDYSRPMASMVIPPFEIGRAHV